jgi:excisionase family DNA binding protein
LAHENTSSITLSLHDAAVLAGVSISTLRRWADEGRVPSFRTQGGHRRFRAADMRQALVPAPAATTDADLFGNLAVTRIRRQLASPSTRELDWMAGVDGRARDRLRLLGRHIMTTIEEYLAARRPKAAVLAEGRQFGLIYGRELTSAGLTVRQGIEAFTFFRRSLEEAARRYATQQRLTPAQLDDLRDHLDALNDRLLLGIAEAYDDPPAGEATAR